MIVWFKYHYISSMNSEAKKSEDGKTVDEKLTDTDSPAHKSESNEPISKYRCHLSKKKVGQYSYHLKDVIGCGFSSLVYKGIKNGNKDSVVALKVIKLKNLTKHLKFLLDNQIRILKMLQHPYIMKFLDVYFTANNCYIVTEYCDGGTLQAAIDDRVAIDWGMVIYQVGQACQYLANQNIMHRDIKPANVLLKEGVWKLSDFGFAQELSNMNSIVKEDYLIGSPLYMPLESLSTNLYSSKSDSFALGVFIYYLLFHHYPWQGQDKEQLIHRLKNEGPNSQFIDHLPVEAKQTLLSLLHSQYEHRIHLSHCNFEVFCSLSMSKNINDQLSKLKRCYFEQLTLCQFLHFLTTNYQQYQDANSTLLAMMSKHLWKLVQVFEWNKQKQMNKLKETYILPIGQAIFENEEMNQLNYCLKDIIRLLVPRMQNQYQVLLEKLLFYHQVVQTTLNGSLQQMLQSIKCLTLHQSFNLLRANPELINAMMSKIDFYSF